MMREPDQPLDPAAITRRRLLLGGGFAVSAALLTARLGIPSADDLRSSRLLGNQPSGGPGRPTEPGSIDGAAAPEPGHVFDRVIYGGRVIDPDSRYDQVASVGIDGMSVTAISTQPLEGRQTIDAEGMVVAPGFIDLLSYQPNDTGIWVKVADGVTTNLGMHGMLISASQFFGTYERDDLRPPCHFGGAFDSAFSRTAIGIGTVEASPDEIRALADRAAEEIEQGWIGIDVQPEYTPWVTTEEYIALGRVAAEHGVPMLFHVRYSAPDDPGQDNAAALAEVLEVARESGASVHVDHITSTGGTHTMEASLATLEQARSDGIDVTACVYPYDFWATYLGSTRFGPGWRERFRIDYEDLVVPGTGERLTEATFAQHQADNTLVAAMGAIPENDLRAALSTPWIMLGSDAILEPGGNNHPRCAGTFARTLGRYARDEDVVSLEEALAKMTILPARRLEDRCPALRRKGRLQLGADADITVFDPERVRDRSTVDEPGAESVGIEWVLVDGNVVKDPDGLQRDTRPGRALRYEST